MMISNKKWIDFLPEDVYQRLANCNSVKSDIPVLVFDDLSTYVNTTTAGKIGVELPDSLLKNEKTVVFE